jgi:uncharacterized protein YwgA
MKKMDKLSDAQAMLLYVLYDLVKHGEYVSEFSSEKVCYFLQRFGAVKYLNLDFEPVFYGPYSGKLQFMLEELKGSYLMGHSSNSKSPFEPLTVVADRYEAIKTHVENNLELLEIANKTIVFLRGFYSDFDLELLSSIDYISSKEKKLDKQLIAKGLEKWNDRKRTLFSNEKYLEVSLKHLQSTSFVEY